MHNRGLSRPDAYLLLPIVGGPIAVPRRHLGKPEPVRNRPGRLDAWWAGVPEPANHETRSLTAARGSSWSPGAGIDIPTGFFKVPASFEPPVQAMASMESLAPGLRYQAKTYMECGVSASQPPKRNLRSLIGILEVRRG